MVNEMEKLESQISNIEQWKGKKTECTIRFGKWYTIEKINPETSARIEQLLLMESKRKLNQLRKQFEEL